MRNERQLAVGSWQFGSLLQNPVWVYFKQRHGWHAVPFGNQFLLERTFPGGVKILYGPELSLPPTSTERQAMINDLRKLARDRRAFLARLDFFTPWSDDLAQELQKLGLKKSFEEIQPEFRQWLDLELELPAILAHMKPKGRYNIGLAQRHGVTVAESSDATMFTKLLAETARRDGFTMRAPAYYHDLITTLRQNNYGELLVASYQNQPLAAAIIGYSPNIPTADNSSFVIRHSSFGPFASYLHGASSSSHREVMAPFLLHWTAIQRAKARGCHIYDLLAVAPPTDGEWRMANGENVSQSLIANRLSLSQKYAGITRFKRQFGGQTVRLLGAWDLVAHPVTYHLFHLLERRRR